MRKLTYIILSACFLALYTTATGQNNRNEVSHEGIRLYGEIVGNDTIPLVYLPDVWVFPRSKFKNKKQERYFWKTVRDVKRTLPYAKLVASELAQVNYKMKKMKNEKERKKYMSEYEKMVFNKHEADLKKMTINQGRILLKLIDRECEKTSYDLIKSYRGGISAFFWQGIARVFGSNLKSEYDEDGDDRILEKVILLVESGQL